MADYSPTENCYAKVDFDREAMKILSSLTMGDSQCVVY